MATFLVGSESNVRPLGPLPAGPIRPSGSSFRALLFGRGGGAVSELGKLEDGYFSCRFRKQCGALPCCVATLSWKLHQVCTRHWLVRHCRPLGLRCVTRIRPEASVKPAVFKLSFKIQTGKNKTKKVGFQFHVGILWRFTSLKGFISSFFCVSVGFHVGFHLGILSDFLSGLISSVM